LNAPALSLVNGPLAAAAYAKEVEVATLGDQLLELREQRAAALDGRAAAESRLRAARDALASAQAAAEAVAATALKDAAALPPGEFGSDLQALSTLSRIGRGELPGRESAERDLARARTAEQTATVELQAAEALVGRLDAQFTDLQVKHQRAEASLLKLRHDHAAELALIQRTQEALEQRLGANFVGRGSLSGMAAHPKALAAVRYALAQIGDPYVWAAEGPNSFDCSGLMWAAYRSVGFELPRVSRDQYVATRGRSVSRYDLLPGDLIFFASGTNWTTIHHVGMYVGNGKMVHAPGTGDAVKISPVYWSRFYAATRIFGEVPASGAPGTPVPPLVTLPGTSTPTQGTTPTPGPTGTATPGPTGTATPGPTGTASPTPTGTASPSPTGSPTPEPTSTSAEPSPSPSPSSPEPTTSSVSPSVASSTEPSPSPTADASPSPSSTGA